MFKALIKVIERLVLEQEEANRLNREYIAYRIKEEQEAKELSLKIRHANAENELKALQQNEKLLEIANGKVQQMINENNNALLRYFDQRFKEISDKD